MRICVSAATPLTEKALLWQHRFCSLCFSKSTKSSFYLCCGTCFSGFSSKNLSLDLPEIDHINKDGHLPEIEMKVVDDSTKVVFMLCQREEIGTEETAQTEMPSPYIVFTDQVVRMLRKMDTSACSSAFNYKISMYANTLKLMRLTNFN